MHRKLTLVALAFASLFATNALGQQSPAAAPESREFFPRYDFALSVISLASPDARFSWDGRIGANIDVLDYVKGRASLFAEYNVVMGTELRSFDPNQGNYTFDISSSARIHKTEIAGVFHHLSRHLSDRSKTPAVAMNTVGIRVLRAFNFGNTGLELRADAGRTVQHSFLDYTWTSDINVVARRPITHVVGWFGRANMRGYRVDSTTPGRGTQTGAYLESGLRFTGRRGAVEVFSGWERRFDAYPVDRNTMDWAFAGFRLLGH